MINIGSYIYSNIGDLVNTHCYPLIADQSTEYPFIISRRSSTAPNSSKDGIFEWEHSVEIAIVDEEYDTCCDILEGVIYRLTSMEGIDPISEVSIDSINEDFVDNAYVKTVNVRLYTEQ
jgi:hypothetical protein